MMQNEGQGRSNTWHAGHSRCTGGYQPAIAAALDVVRSNSDNVSSDPAI
jgi:hypothetical protein